MDLHSLSIDSLHKGLLSKEIRALQVVQDYFAAIKAKDAEIGAFLNLREEEALREAESVDLGIREGRELAPLAGVPIALKDNMLIEGAVSTAGSRLLKTYVASYDAHVVKLLRRAGAVIVGKTNLDEFAMGSSTENSAYQITKNPHDLTRVAGGSSGGSAAAVAADMALVSLGSDTGGSIREPAAFCGVVGMKPTYGTVSRSGLIAMASSLDQIGPFAKTVRDAALIYQVIAGHDGQDATSVPQTYDTAVASYAPEAVKRLRIGIPDEYFVDGMDPAVREGVLSVIAAYEKLGVSVSRVSLPHTRYALSAYYILQPAEVSANLSRFDGVRYARNADPGDSLLDLYTHTRSKGFGPEVKRRIILGAFVLSSGYYDAYYGKARAVQSLIRKDFEQVFKTVDVLLTPVVPTPAFPIGSKTANPLEMYLSDIFTIPVNLAGLPGMSIPVRGVSGLPIGFQLIGNHFREADIFGLGMLYEDTVR
jgi:aspartyl-tRNA(Asn)/glutamyl-tRNA(Gln) amidotransferase subunit A